MISNHVNRRQFMKSSAGFAAVGAIAPPAFSAQAKNATAAKLHSPKRS